MTSVQIKADAAVGEVIESSSTRFTAECPHHRLQNPPPLGSFVKVSGRGQMLAPALVFPAEEPEFEDPFADSPRVDIQTLQVQLTDGTLYGLVCEAITESIEPGRRAAAYGLDEEELRAEQPQIFDLLATRFGALHIAHVASGRIRTGVPPVPPRIHAPVEECTADEVRAITDSPDLLRLILSGGDETLRDELIVAVIRRAYLCHNEDFAFLVRMGKQIATLMREDPERVNAILRKLQP